MDPLTLITALLVLLIVTVIVFGGFIMATFGQISDAQLATAAAIADLATRVGNSSGITAAEAETLLAQEQANLAAVQAIP